MMFLSTFLVFHGGYFYIFDFCLWLRSMAMMSTVNTKIGTIRSIGIMLNHLQEAIFTKGYNNYICIYDDMMESIVRRHTFL